MDNLMDIDFDAYLKIAKKVLKRLTREQIDYHLIVEWLTDEVHGVNTDYYCLDRRIDREIEEIIKGEKHG